MRGGIQLISSIYRGIFWIICHYDEESYPIFELFDLLAFKVECDENGNILDHTIQLNAKSGTSFNHKMQWDQLPKKLTKNHSYQDYPRGRVEIRHGKAIIFLNPILNQKIIIDKICLEFHLNCEKIKQIEVKLDGSYHYHCYYDDASIY